MTLVVEILGPGNTAFEPAWKPQRYAAGGIAYYLEVELGGVPEVTAYELRGKGYVKVADAHAEERLKLPEPSRSTSPQPTSSARAAPPERTASPAAQTERVRRPRRPRRRGARPGRRGRSPVQTESISNGTACVTPASAPARSAMPVRNAAGSKSPPRPAR